MYLPSSAPVPTNSMSPLDPVCVQKRVQRGRQIAAAAFDANAAVSCFASPDSFSPWGTNLVADVVQSQNDGVTGPAADATGNVVPGGPGLNPLPLDNSDAPIVVPLNPTGGQIPGGCAIPVAPKSTVVIPRMIPSQRIELQRDPVQPSQDLILVRDAIIPPRNPFNPSVWQAAYASIMPSSGPTVVGPAAPVGYAQIVASGLGQIAPPWGDEFLASIGGNGNNGGPTPSSGSFVHDHPWLSLFLALGLVVGVDQLSK